MNNLTNEEMYLAAIKASGMTPGKNYSEKQLGILMGVTIGAIMIRDNLSIDDAQQRERDIRNSLHKKWVSGELKELKTTG